MTTTTTSRPLCVGRGRGNALRFLGQPLEVKLAGEQTGGAYAVTEATVEPGFGPGPHIHRREDEAVYVLDGVLRFKLGEAEFDAPTGTLVHIPRGLLHSWNNVADNASTLLTVYTPAGFEGIFEALGEPLAGPSTPLTLDALREGGREYGLDIPDPDRAALG